MLGKTLQQQNTEQDLKSEKMELKGQVVMLTQAREELGKRAAHVAKARDVAEQLAQNRLKQVDEAQLQVRAYALAVGWPTLLPTHKQLQLPATYFLLIIGPVNCTRLHASVAPLPA